MLSFRTSLSITSPATANAINTALPAPTSTSSGNDLLLLVMELAIISAVAILEMKAKILTKLHRYLKGIFKKMHPLLIKTLWAAVIICCALLVLFYYGVVWFLFMCINGGGIMAVGTFYGPKVKQWMSIGITFVFFIILWEFILIIANSSHSLALALFAEFAYLPLAFLAAVLLMGNPTKNRMNAVALFSSLMMPLFLGSLFTPLFAVILLVVFAAYDAFAVWGTHHMQFLAQRLVAMNIPEVFMIGDVELMKMRLAGAVGGKPVEIPEEKRPLLLGAGDAILPSAVISTFVFAHMPWLAAVVMGGCILGIMLNLYVLKRRKSVLPALVLICISMLALLGLAIVF
jgi:presenilin-like A22 family membrane protease